jgi:hypothetical protein
VQDSAHVICRSVFLMADTSSYSIKERLVASVWVHKRQHTGQTMSQVMAAFALGSVKDRPRSGTKTTCLETCEAVAATIERSPMKSTRKRSSELGVPRTTMQDHMKKDLNVNLY